MIKSILSILNLNNTKWKKLHPLKSKLLRSNKSKQSSLRSCCQWRNSRKTPSRPLPLLTNKIQILRTICLAWIKHPKSLRSRPLISVVFINLPRKILTKKAPYKFLISLIRELSAVVFSLKAFLQRASAMMPT